MENSTADAASTGTSAAEEAAAPGSQTEPKSNEKIALVTDAGNIDDESLQSDLPGSFGSL